jgi:hypothetical protein
VLVHAIMQVTPHREGREDLGSRGRRKRPCLQTIPTCATRWVLYEFEYITEQCYSRLGRHARLQLRRPGDSMKPPNDTGGKPWQIVFFASPSLCRRDPNPPECLECAATTRLIRKWGYAGRQVCEAMLMMAEAHLIHRALALRHVLVSSFHATDWRQVRVCFPPQPLP